MDELEYQNSLEKIEKDPLYHIRTEVFKWFRRGIENSSCRDISDKFDKLWKNNVIHPCVFCFWITKNYICERCIYYNNNYNPKKNLFQETFDRVFNGGMYRSITQHNKELWETIWWKNLHITNLEYKLKQREDIINNTNLDKERCNKVKIFLNDEDKVQEFLQNKFLELGWDVEREVASDETKDWDNPHRIDLVVFDSDLKKLMPMGIEVKYIRKTQSGSLVSQAINQILFQYGREHFNEKRLKTLVLAFYYERGHDHAIITKSMIIEWGIGFIYVNNPNNSVLRLQFGGDNQSDMKIMLDIQNRTYYKSNVLFPNKQINQEKILKKSSKWKKLITKEFD